MKKLIILLFLLGIVLISGCVKQKEPKEVETTTTVPVIYHPENIQLFKGVEEHESKYSSVLQDIKFYFALVDKDEKNTLGDGKASIQIKDSGGKVLFTRDFDFKSSDFVDYQDTEKKTIKVYEFRIKATDIQKTMLRAVGTADLTLTMNDDKILKDTYSGFEIPSYTEEELKQVWEEEYNENAKFSREVISKGNFEVTLVKYGFYNHFIDSFWRKNRTDFRVDIKVKNIGSELNCFDIDDAKMIFGSKEYKNSLYSNFPFLTNCMEAGFLEEGYIVYIGGYGENDVVPHNLTGQIKINVGDESYDNKNDFYEFTVVL